MENEDIRGDQHSAPYGAESIEQVQVADVRIAAQKRIVAVREKEVAKSGEIGNIPKHKEEFLADIQLRKEKIAATNRGPFLTHWSFLKNFNLMIEKANDPEFGQNAFRIRVHEINERLGLAKLITRGWSRDHNTVSFYAGGTNFAYSSEREFMGGKRIDLVDDPTGDTGYSAVKESNDVVSYCLPAWRALYVPATRYFRADASEFNIGIDPADLGRSNDIRAGIDVYDWSAQIYIPKHLEVEYRSEIEKITDTRIREQLLSKVHFLSPEEFAAVRQQTTTGNYINEFVQLGLTPQQQQIYYEQVAIFSLINLYDLQKNSGRTVEDTVASLQEIAEQRGSEFARDMLWGQHTRDYYLPQLMQRVCSEYFANTGEYITASELYDRVNELVFGSLAKE